MAVLEDDPVDVDARRPRKLPAAARLVARLVTPRSVVDETARSRRQVHDGGMGGVLRVNVDRALGGGLQPYLGDRERVTPTFGDRER
jgi:hypothetical protein